MNYIANINKSDLDLTFQITNRGNNKIPIKVSFVNALRRIILTDIPIVNVSEKKTQFIKNSSMLNNQILAHRMNLFSVLNTDFVEKNFNNIVVHLNKENKNDEIETVYVKDFEIRKGDEKVDVNKVFKFPNSIFAKVKHNQSIVMNANLERSNVRESGAGHCPVSTCVYYFEYDKNDEDEDKERKYGRDKLGNPAVYNFSIESSGQMNPSRIFVTGLDVLINKLNVLKDDIQNKYKNKVIINKSPTKMNAIDFKLIEETDTVANLIIQYIDFVEKVDYKGYDIVHPLKKEIIVRVGHGTNTEESASALFVKTIDFLIDFTKKFKDEWTKKN